MLIIYVEQAVKQTGLRFMFVQHKCKGVNSMRFESKSAIGFLSLWLAVSLTYH